jgi:hypothetical protein
MSRMIFRYQVPLDAPNDVIEIMMPKDANILHFAEQEGGLYIWAISQWPSVEQAKFSFCIYGSGWEIPDTTKDEFYIGTVQQGPYTWHLYKFYWPDPPPTP